MSAAYSLHDNTEINISMYHTLEFINLYIPGSQLTTRKDSHALVARRIGIKILIMNPSLYGNL